jgi:hypothetical protein
LQWLLDRDSVDLVSEIRLFLTVVVPAMAAAGGPTSTDQLPQA